MPTATFPTLRVAIIGGGPGGLGTAIALSKLPNVDVALYEQARELREVGAGINIGYNCWRVLELLGAAEGVRGHLAVSTIHRNALDGTIVIVSPKSSLPLKYRSRRVRRTRLQAALVAQVPKDVIKLRKRLQNIEDIVDGGVRLRFEDGSETVVDLVVGGDGIRSVVRQHLFPDHAIKFTGTTIWRTLIPFSTVSQISDMDHSTNWWHGPGGHFYATVVDDPAEVPEPENQMFEISCRNVIDPKLVTEKRFSWGVPATNERVVSHFKGYDPRVTTALEQVPEGNWKEFSAFAGPRLNRVTGWDKIVLIGDASHPLSGAFGSGAAFALEDGWILARAIEHTRSSTKASAGIPAALDIFNSVRSPYYHKMYEFLDQQKENVLKAKALDPDQSFVSSLNARLAAFGGEEKMAWIYQNDIEKVWKNFVEVSQVAQHGETSSILPDTTVSCAAEQESPHDGAGRFRPGQVDVTV